MAKRILCVGDARTTSTKNSPPESNTVFRIVVVCVLLVAFGCSTRSSTEPEGAAVLFYTGTVASYEINANWDHIEDGSFAVQDRLTVKLESGQTFPVSVLPAAVLEDSPFRVPGTRFKLSLSEPLSDEVYLSWGAIESPTILE